MFILKDEFPSTILEEVLDNLFQFNSVNETNKPIYDIIENEEGFNIEVQLPGIKKDDVDISTEDNKLLIGAERKKNDDVKFKRKQSFDGKYELVFILPKEIDKEEINASMSDGILIITLLKIIDPEKLGKKTIKIE